MDFQCSYKSSPTRKESLHETCNKLIGDSEADEIFGVCKSKSDEIQKIIESAPAFFHKSSSLPSQIVSMVSCPELQIRKTSLKIASKLLLTNGKIKELLVSYGLIEEILNQISVGWIDEYSIDCLINMGSEDANPLTGRICIHEILACVHRNPVSFMPKLIELLSVMCENQSFTENNFSSILEVLSEVYEQKFDNCYRCGIQLIKMLNKSPRIREKIWNRAFVLDLIVLALSTIKVRSAEDEELITNACGILSFLIDNKIVTSTFDLEPIEFLALNLENSRSKCKVIDEHRHFIRSFPEMARCSIERNFHVNLSSAYESSTYNEKVSISLWLSELFQVSCFSQVIQLLDNLSLSFVTSAISLDDPDTSLSVLSLLSCLCSVFEQNEQLKTLSDCVLRTRCASAVREMTQNENRRIASKAAIVSSQLLQLFPTSEESNSIRE